MWIVDIALRRPYTFLVVALMIVLTTPLVLFKMPTDVLPNIDIPVISVIWTYTGLSAKDMEGRITTVNERSLTTTVNNIEHIESQSLPGIAIIKLFLQPDASLQTAIAQTVANEQAQLKQMPPGATPPLVISYSASSIPVIQLGMAGGGATEQQLSDTALNFLRPQIVTIPGAASPYPYGGKTRVISVDLDTRALLAKGLAPSDVVNAVNTQNLILPTGTVKLAQSEYTVDMNGSPSTIAALNDIPVRTVNGATTYLREVAHVRDGFTPQTNIVRQDGHRGVLMTVLKSGNASTLAIVSALKAKMDTLQQLLPKGAKLTPLFDQSIFVKASVQGLIREALIAAALTALLILLFLGNWRTTVIIAVSIPLSIMTSVIVLFCLGQTINIMTLGGLALAVGILVDDATVTIENIERHRHDGAELHDAIRDGAGEIAIPALVSTLCICIVFVPMFFLTGVARYLFVPLAESVVFAMLASYFLSRTLVPTLALMLMQRPEGDEHTGKFSLKRVYQRFDQTFDKLRGNYIVLLGIVLERRRLYGSVFFAFCLLSAVLVFALGRDFFPEVDAGQIRLHMRAPTGYRIEETARLADQVEQFVRKVVPQDQLQTIVDNLGLPNSGINLSYSNAGTIGSLDAEIQIALMPDHDRTDDYVDTLRRELPRRFPGVEFFFQPADIVTQILNFGQPAAIDLRISGKDQAANSEIAKTLLKQVLRVPGTIDSHIQQRMDAPFFRLEMDRTRLQQLGLSAINVSQNVLISLSGSTQTAPAFWLSPQNGVEYSLAVQTPQYQILSVDDLLRTPVTGASPGASPQLLGNLVRLSQTKQPAVVNHYDIKPSSDVYVSVEGRDLGGVASDIGKIVDRAKKSLPQGTTLTLSGQVATMQTSFVGLGVGVAMAIVLVYLIIVINFQSWLDPLVIISALPAALAGIIWMLFLTRTHLSVPALTGAIMTVGVATANSILVVAFARQRLEDGESPVKAALDAGATRIRPVLMTATAMVIGMVPMALGLGEGAEQNAPLGRAVIGGLLLATVSTLLFVPLVFASVHTRLQRGEAAGGKNGEPRDPPSGKPQDHVGGEEKPQDGQQDRQQNEPDAARDGSSDGQQGDQGGER